MAGPCWEGRGQLLDWQEGFDGHGQLAAEAARASWHARAGARRAGAGTTQPIWGLVGLPGPTERPKRTRSHGLGSRMLPHTGRPAAAVGPPSAPPVLTGEANPRSSEDAAAAGRVLAASLATHPLCRARPARSPERSACRSMSEGLRQGSVAGCGMQGLQAECRRISIGTGGGRDMSCGRPPGGHKSSTHSAHSSPGPAVCPTQTPQLAASDL